MWLAAGSEVMIFDLNNLSGATNHNGGAIHFGPDGKLYIDVGENANAANSQSIGNLLGKVLRINSDGTIPADNPTSFPESPVLQPATTAPSGPSAYAIRTPLPFSPVPGRMFINDVGEGHVGRDQRRHRRLELWLEPLRRFLRPRRMQISEISISVWSREFIDDWLRNYRRCFL